MRKQETIHIYNSFQSCHSTIFNRFRGFFTLKFLIPGQHSRPVCLGGRYGEASSGWWARITRGPNKPEGKGEVRDGGEKGGEESRQMRGGGSIRAILYDTKRDKI